MSSLEEANAFIAEQDEEGTAAPAQLSSTTYIREADLPALVDVVETVFPDGRLHKAALKARLPSGETVAAWCWHQRGIGSAGQDNYRPSVTVTVYRSGTVVWQGTEPVFPVPEPESNDE